MGRSEVISSVVLGHLSVEVKAISSDRSAGGLLLAWTALPAKNHESKILLSKFAKSAALFCGELSLSQVASLTNRRRASQTGSISAPEKATEDPNPGSTSEDYAPCALALTDTGNLTLAIFEELCCELFFLGRVPFPVMWVGTVHDGSARLVCAVQPSGVVHLCTPIPNSRTRRFQWKVVPLNTRVIAACAFTNSLVTSDGFNISIHSLKVEKSDPSSDLCPCFSCRTILHDTKSIEFPGVVSLVSLKTEVTFVTVDGRRYQETQNAFFDRVQMSESNSKSATVKVDHNISLDGRLKEMRDIGQLTSKIVDLSEKRNLYIKQLNLAQHLLNSSEENSNFNLSYDVRSCVDPDYAYKMELQFSSKEKSLELDKRWWRLRIGVPACRKIRFISASMSEELPSVVIGLTLEEVKFLVFSSSQDGKARLTFDVIFMDYEACKPLVCIPTARLQPCVWKFLSEKQNLTTRSSKENSSLDHYLQRCLEAQNHASVLSSSLHHAFSIECPNHNSVVSKLYKLLRIKETSNESFVKFNKRFFYDRHSVVVKGSPAKNVLKIVVSSSSANIAITLKKHLDDLCEKLSAPKSGNIFIDAAVVEHVLGFQYFLEASKADSLHVLSLRKICGDLYAVLASLPR